MGSMASGTSSAGRFAERSARAGALALRAMLFALLWWALANGDARSWVVGVPAVILAMFLATRLSAEPIFLPRPLALLRFLVDFLRLSFVGGLDVARRALSPAMPLDPALVPCTTRLPTGPQRRLLAAVVSLLPGTLCARLEGDGLLIHTLDRGLPVVAQVRHLENGLAAMFGHRLPAPDGNEP